MKENTFLLIGPFRQLITMADLPDKGALTDDLLQPVIEAGILMEDEKIYKVGIFSELIKEAQTLHAAIIQLNEDVVAIPGFIDAHTHICFAGSRANDYAMRNAGKSYLEIAAAGGGIWDTVQHTRKASMEELAALTLQHANRHLQEGITTIEVKSGYGLSAAAELKILKAIKKAAEQTPADLIPTCLAAHILPKDYNGTHEDYLQEISHQLFPMIIEEQLTTRIDAFIEEGAFAAEQITPYFTKAKELGFHLTVHADQFHPSGSAVAVQFAAVSADHLEASGEKEIQLLAKSNVVPIALPGASIGLGVAFAPARRLLDAGASLAIASDWNPGSAPMGDLLTQAAILGTFEKLSNAEVLAGITYRAANALQCSDRGKIQQGLLADFIVFPTNNYQEILYQQGRLKPTQVWKRGKLINDYLNPSSTENNRAYFASSRLSGNYSSNNNSLIQP
ncbi:imidazolonepropionase [Ilyomonas limi]|uniref:Imidazolonepropionase n=1 Tax=Ilyomonas limi TaxID=2575867 RepID=A0A4U3KVR0_9BACT|nr:imidazolonepropionase [Ilyomonas limi]TKK66601.1 imidazolonepropionase [Ilyomonas limi]